MQVVIPVKDLRSSKSRLAHALPDYARPTLMGALLGDLLEQLQACREVTGISVITRCPQATALATALGAGALCLDEDRCLNSGVAAAIALLAQRGLPEAMILHGDLPLAEADDIDHVIRTHRDNAAAVTLVPDSQRNGTNALLLTLPSAMTFHYGPQSYRQHLRHCEQHGLPVQTVTCEALGDDLDIWQDFVPLLALPAIGQRPRLACWLAQYNELFDWPLAANL